MKFDTQFGSIVDVSPSLDVSPDLPNLMEATLSQSPTALTVSSLAQAQQFEENFFDRSGEILGNFVDSGQLWALLIGVVLGYFIRSLTTYS